MIYLNHVNIKAIYGNVINLGNFLPNCELSQLITSCGKKGKVNYGGAEYNLNASNFRVAHNSVALKFGLAGNLLASNSQNQISLHQVSNCEKISYNEVRTLVEEHKLKKESEELIEKIKEIREGFIDQKDNTNAEEFSQNINAFSQASRENTHINQTENTYDQVIDDVIDIPQDYVASSVEGASSNTCFELQYDCSFQ